MRIRFRRPVTKPGRSPDRGRPRNQPGRRLFRTTAPLSARMKLARWLPNRFPVRGWLRRSRRGNRRWPPRTERGLPLRRQPTIAPPNDGPHRELAHASQSSGRDDGLVARGDDRGGRGEIRSLAHAYPEVFGEWRVALATATRNGCDATAATHRQPGSELPRRKNEYVSQSTEAGVRVVGIALLAGGRGRRYATTARTSSSSRLESRSQVIPCQCSWRPWREMPLRMARATGASLQAPMPVSPSEEMLRA